MAGSETAEIEVVAAVIWIDGKIFCVKKGKTDFDYISFKFEFPGGKIEDGETHQQALTREMLEELDLSITVDRKLIQVRHAYPDFTVKIHCYLCHVETLQGYLNEHLEYKMMPVAMLDQLEWLEADKPVVKYLMEMQ